ncbi:MAG: hypothetical protein IJ853_03770 [Rickettsiales bacterium]|nr:hypothetical protein [Rickettsiales bacterium]
MTDKVKSIKEIKNIAKLYGVTLNVNEETLEKLLLNIKSVEEVKQIPLFVANVIKADTLMKFFKQQKSEITAALDKEFIKNCARISDLDKETFSKFTPEQVESINKKVLSNRIMDLNDNSLLHVINSTDNLPNIPDEDVYKAFSRLNDAKQLSKISDEAISYYSEFIADMDDSILSNLNNPQLKELDIERLLNRAETLTPKLIVNLININADKITKIPEKTINALNMIAEPNEVKNVSPEVIATLKGKISDLDQKIMGKLTPEQVENIDEVSVDNLIISGKLSDLQDDTLSALGDKINLGGTYNILKKLGYKTDNNVSNEIKLLQEKGKIKLLTPKTLSTINDQTFKDENVITKEFISNLNLEQINGIGYKIKFLNAKGFSGINKGILQNANEEIIRNISTKQIQEATREQQIELFTNTNVDQLNKWYAKPELFKHIDNGFLEKIEENTLARQINSLKTDFFKLLDPDAIVGLSGKVIQNIDRECFESITAKQLNKLCFDDENKIKNLPDDIFNIISMDKFKELDDRVLKLIDKKNLVVGKTISQERLDEIVSYLVKENKVSQLNNGAIQILNNKIELEKLKVEELQALANDDKLKNFSAKNLVSLKDKKLDSLEEKQLKNIASLNTSTPTHDTEGIEIFKDTLGDIENEPVEYDIRDNIEAKITAFIDEEAYEGLAKYCMYIYRKDEDARNTVTDVLQRKHEQLSKSTRFYDKIDDFEVLKIMTLLTKEKQKSEEYYKNMEDVINEINEMDLINIDEYMTRINKFSEIVKDGDFNIDFIEKLAEQNVANTENFIHSYYSGRTKNSVDTILKDKYADVLLDYANVIAKKYDVDEEKIMKNLNDIDKKGIEERKSIIISRLSKEEQLYINLLNKAMANKPDLKSKVKAWTTPIFQTVMDCAGTLFTTKLIATSTNSAIATVGVGTVGAIKTIKDISEEVNKKSYFAVSDEERRNIHTRQRGEIEGRFALFKRLMKRTARKYIYKPFSSFMGFIDKHVFGVVRKKVGLEAFNRNNKSTEFLTNNFKKTAVSNRINKELESLKKKSNKRYGKFNDKLQTIQTREADLIKNFIAMKKKAIDLIKKKQMEKLYEEYPQFRERGFFGRMFNSCKELISSIASIGSGIISSAGDMVTFGNFDKIYNTLISDRGLMEKIKDERKRKLFVKKVLKIELEHRAKKEELKKEEVRRLAALNAKDKQVVDNYEQEYQAEFNSIKKDFNSLLPRANEIKDKLFDFCNLAGIGDKEIAKYDDIEKKLNENGILEGVNNLEKLNSNPLKKQFGEQFNEAFKQVVSLASIENVNKNTISKNVGLLLDIAYKTIDEGRMNIKDVETSLVPLLAIDNICKQSKNQMPQLINNDHNKVEEKVKEKVNRKYINLIERQSQEADLQKSIY